MSERTNVTAPALADAMRDVWITAGREDIGDEAWSGFAIATLARLHMDEREAITQERERLAAVWEAAKAFAECSTPGYDWHQHHALIREAVQGATDD